MPFGPGFAAIQTPTVGPSAMPGAGGAVEVSTSQIAGFPVATITVTTNVTAQTATIAIHNTQVTATSSTTVALTLTAIAAAISANSTLTGQMTVATTATAITLTSKVAGPAGMFEISASGAGGLVLAPAASEFDFPNNIVLPLATGPVATPSGGVLTMYAGIPIPVDPITKAFLKAQKLVA